MAELKYNTRGYSSLWGKAKVYFTAHPSDYDLCFDDICKDILERQNCAVFYLDANANYEDVEDYELQLNEMQLFVVPVTLKLLTTPNRALDIDVAFALSNNIPVLPLIQEEGLESLFNEKFGDIQFLNKNTNDTTAIAFDKKLTEYLNSVMIGNRLADKIREKFDAYIFLSYRKKDRRYAQELMKLIHSNPFCRDIAIWYDEFLTPGENFNGAIKTALEKSDVFVLTVTPNVLELQDGNPNFVMGVEYPEAIKSGKAILPVEMCATDREELKKKYSSIPEIISADDSDSLASGLLKLTKKFTVSENDSDPEHNYYIGLAYLSGVDVEVNHELAVELITSSAMSGYYPAIDKLVDMYIYGEGIKRDYLRAVEWQEKLVGIDKKAYDEKSSMDNAEDLLMDMQILSSNYSLASLVEEQKRTNLEIIELCDRIVRKYSKTRFFMINSIKKRFLKFKAEALDELGEIAQEYDKLEEAEKYYSQAMEIRKIIKSKWDDDYDSFSSYYNFAKLSYQKGDNKQALEYYHKCIGIINGMSDRYGIKDYRLKLADVYGDIGQIYYNLGDYKCAKEYKIKAVELYKAYIIVSGSTMELSDISYEYSMLAKIAKKNYDTESELEYLENALEYAREYARNEEDTYIILCRRLSDLGDYYFINGYGEQAEQLYLEAYDIAVSNFTNSNDYVCIKCLNESARDLGKIYSSGEKEDEVKASSFFEKAVSLAEMAIENRNSVAMITNLVYDYLRLSTLTSDTKREREYLEKAIENYNKLEKMSSDQDCKSECSFCATILGDYYVLPEEMSLREMYYKKATVFAERLVEECPDLSNRKDLFDCYMEIGDFYVSDSSYISLALDYYKTAFEVIEKIAVETGSLEDSKSLFVVLKRLGLCYLKLKKYDEASECCQRCVMVGEVIVDGVDAIDSYRDLLDCYSCLNVIALQTENLDDRFRWINKMIELSTTLAERTDSPEDYDNLLSLIREYGDICREHNKFKESKLSYLKCYDISKKLLEKDETAKNLKYCFDYLLTLGRLSFRELHDDDAAERCFAEAFGYIERVLELKPSSEIIFELSEYYGYLAEFEKHKNNIQKAREYYIKQIDALKNIAEETNDPQYYNALACAYLDCDVFMEDSRLLDEAKKIWERLIDETDDPLYREICTFNLNSLNE